VSGGAFPVDEEGSPTMRRAPSPVQLSDLVSILAECGSNDSGEALVPITEDVLDEPFYDLGYDSLLLLQASDRMAERFGVHVPEEVLDLAETPRMLLDIVHRCGQGALV
jgi:acyl carrier protein